MIVYTWPVLPFIKARGWSSTLFFDRYFDDPCDFFCFPFRIDFFVKGSILSTAGPADIVFTTTGVGLAVC